MIYHILSLRSVPWKVAYCLIPCLLLLGATAAEDGFAQTTIVDFEFNEAAGTALMDDPNDGIDPVVSDSVSGQTWSPRDPGDEVDLQNIVTDGTGLLDVSGYDSGSTRDASLELAPSDQITSSQNPIGILTVEFAPWSFGPYVSGDDEEVRAGFGNTSATNTLGIFVLERIGTDQVTLRADAAGAGADGVAVDLFDDVQIDPVTVVLKIDKSTNTYGISYAVGAGPLTPLAGNTGLALDPARNGNFLRLAFDEPYTGDTFAIDRYTVAVVPEPTTMVTLLLSLMGVCVSRPRRIA